jgi:hypothetical protein
MEQAGTLAGELVTCGGRIRREPPSILKRTDAADLSYRTDGAISGMPADVEYRGHRIVWDARQVEGTAFWTGRAAIVSPADISGIKSVYKIRVNAYFVTEREVRDHLIGMAKDRIDNGLEI